MSPLSIIPALVCVALALLTCGIIRYLKPIPLPLSRFSTIDGLRGYLAFFVFLHHAAIWYYFLRSGAWQVPPSNLYTHFGQTSVSLFFMITGFLFTHKLLQSKNRPIDWLQLYISRFMRIYPAYIFAIAIMFTIAFFMTGYTLHESVLSLLKKTIQWGAFRTPDINGLVETRRIMAGVTWTLPYEWLFYLCLPALSLLIGRRAPMTALATTIIIASLILSFWRPSPILLCMFLAGGIAALTARSEWLQSLSNGRLGSLLCVCLIGSAVIIFPTAYTLGPAILLSLAFILITAGCSIFGLLNLSVSRFFGEITYSLYLLHGIVLYVIFEIVLGNQAAKEFDTRQHWMIIYAATPFILSFFSVYRTPIHECFKGARSPN
ncbi:acyltransferase family protein [Pseudomonas aeruginosa]|uniref:acyltransferase family protein n=1 Tax=Pseudomonas aeruginosa TaxID=287 RepID=UPI001F0973BC|nr:acyltransferase [Pseudomonas aeruginosa]